MSYKIPQESVKPARVSQLHNRIRAYSSDALSAGEIVAVSGFQSGHMAVTKADANSASAFLVRGKMFIVDHAVPAGSYHPAYLEWKVITGTYSGSAGAPLYLSNTAGAISESAGDVPVIIGYILSSTQAMIWPGMSPLFANKIYTISKQVVHGDLTDGDTAQTIDFASTIPVGHIVIGASFNVATLFSGGGTGSAALDVGFATDLDAYVDAEDIFTGAATGIRRQFANESLGLKGKGVDSSSSVITPQITITTDTTVAAFSAGDVTVTLIVLAV